MTDQEKAVQLVTILRQALIEGNIQILPVRDRTNGHDEFLLCVQHTDTGCWPAAVLCLDTDAAVMRYEHENGTKTVEVKAE